MILSQQTGADTSKTWYNINVKRLRVKEYRMYKANKRTFEINFREAGNNSYYTAKCGHVVYTSKSLSYLKNKIWGLGDTFTIKSASSVADQLLSLRK